MRRGQTTAFIIIGVVIVAAVIAFILFRGGLSGSDGIPRELAPVFEHYEQCIESEARTAVDLAGIQGGRVYAGDYVPGSEYAPFSSHLNFLGSPVKYWYYVSGNGLIKEEIPTLTEMENEIADYVKEGLARCDFEYYYRQQFGIEVGDPDVKVTVLERKVLVDVSSEVSASKDDTSARKTSFEIEINSKLGKFYDMAKEIYSEEKRAMFLEDYAVDVLYHYAPVDGVEIQCAPKIWLTQKVISGLKEGLENNFRTIKFDGSYHDTSDERKYFVYDYPVDEAVNVVYSQDWPTKVEIHGDGVDDEIMSAEPVGTQEGLGVMGFCFVPYHFVYDVSFPAMIQIYDSGELFQFPIVVVIDKNMPRNALESGYPFSDTAEFDLCEYKNEDVTINLYDINLNKVDANVSYECFNQRCRLGESRNGVLRTAAPACVNGFLHLRAEGYADKKQQMSTNKESFAEVIMEREHDVDVELKVAGRELSGTAIVTFVKEDGTTKTLALPGVSEVELSEGPYEIKVYVYGNSSITLPASTRTECVDAPRGGLLGLLGSTKEECFDVTIPETKIEHALIGGGVQETYILESELEKGHLTLSVDALPRPDSLDDLANNFELFDQKNVGVSFDVI